MSDEESVPTPGEPTSRSEEERSSSSGAAVATAGGSGDQEIDVRLPEFAALSPGGAAGDGQPLDRFYDVNVTVWAELGRVTMPLGELLQLGEGSVLKLGRAVSAPVDLMAQGVRVARGEVVVVDDSFAIRIKEIEPPRR